MAAAAAGVRQHHHAGGGSGGSGTKGVARRHSAVVHEGLRDEGGGEGGPRSRRLETPLQGWVGQEGGKKSDKTIERNLNYAPRKMAIVCKAMLIRRGRKRAGADFADAARRDAVGFFATGIVSSIFFFFFFHCRPRSLRWISFPDGCAAFLRTLRTASPSPPVGPLSERSSFAFFPSFSRFISAYIYCTFLIRSP